MTFAPVEMAFRTSLRENSAKTGTEKKEIGELPITFSHPSSPLHDDQYHDPPTYFSALTSASPHSLSPNYYFHILYLHLISFIVQKPHW